MRERADEESIWLILDNMARGRFCTSNKGYAGKYDGPWVRFKKGLFDIQAILEQDQRCVTVVLWQSGSNQVKGGGSDVWYALGANNDIVIRGKIFGGDVRNSVANYDGLAVMFMPLTSVEVGFMHTNTRAEPFQCSMVTAFDGVSLLFDSVVV